MPPHQQSHFIRLKDAWIKKHQKVKKDLWNKHAKSLAWMKQNSQNLVIGSATGLLMVTHPASASTLTQNLLPPPPEERTAHTKDELIRSLAEALPTEVAPLSDEQKIKVGHILTTFFHMPVSSSLEGKSLNRSYGIIGAEQHLMRYPGDTMNSHFQTEDEKQFWSSGMAPGRGAWGYFTPSRSEMSPEDVAREKYYIAVQTFLSPGWKENTREMYAFFKYRKMLVVNPENGKAVVAVIGDAGPSPRTGKHLGGSPEVMAHLERVDGGARGPVLYYFIDDPGNTIPLGPISIE